MTVHNCVQNLTSLLTSSDKQTVSLTVSACQFIDAMLYVGR